MSVRILIANPAARFVRLHEAQWIVSAANADEIVAWIATSQEAAVRLPPELAPLLEDGTVIRLDVGGSVEAIRSVATLHDLFVVEPRSGPLVISDSFHDAIASLPPNEREVRPTALLDHLAFTYLWGESTHLSRVWRLCRGDLLTIDEYGAFRRKVVERLELQRGSASVPLAADHLGRALSAALANARNWASPVNALSGGIDSTLLQHYLSPRVPSMSVAVHSEEFRFEVDYALRASSLLNTRHQLIDMQEDEILGALERVVDELAVPPTVVQIALFSAVFDAPYSTIVVGDHADSLFGGVAVGRADRAWRDGSGADSSEKSLREQLARPIDDPDGFGSRGVAVSSDLSLVGRLFGEDSLRQRIAARYSYVMERLELADDSLSHSIRHLELASLLNWFSDEAGGHWRQVAYWRGKSVIIPYLRRDVLQAVWGVPAENRYVSEGTVKPIPKYLLSKLLPSFDSEAVKGGSGLPRTRYLETGPLRDAVSSYGLPPEFDPAHHEAILPVRWDTSWTLYALLTFSMWQKRVLQAQHLTLNPRTRVITASVS